MRKMDWKRAIWGFAVGVLLIPREASAQLPEAIYGDAKDIIEELLTTEIATQVAPGIACLSGQTDTDAADPRGVTYTFEQGDKDVTKTVRLAATTHFPKTLQAVYNRRFGRLRGTIRDESANFAAYVVYGALHAAALQAGAARAADPKSKNEANAAAENALAFAAAQAEKAMEDAPTDLDDPPGDGKATDAAPPAAITVPRFGSLSSEELSACKNEVKKKLLDGSWGQTSNYPIDDECKGRRPESVECHLGYAVRSGLLGQPAATQDNLIKAAAAVVREVASAHATDAHQLDVIEHQALFLLRKALTGDSWEGKPLEDVVATIAKVTVSLDLTRLTADARAQLNAALTSLGHLPSDEEVTNSPTLAAARKVILEAVAQGGGPTEPAAATALAARLLELVKLLARLEEVHATWRSVVNLDTGKIELISFLRTVAADQGPLAALCKDAAGPACAVIGYLPLIAKPAGEDKLGRVLNDIKPILLYSSRGEYTEAAQNAIGYLFQRINADNNADVSVYKNFVQSVAGYVLDAADGEPPSETARVAFRKASVEMIQHLGEGSGIRRRYSSAWSGIKIALLPDLALRASWSPSYVNQDASSARILASANWLNVRFTIRRTEPTYLGVELSALDPLAPLSELALRKTEKTHYRKVENLFGGVLAPRVEFLAASPMLSEHLGVSAGISLRWIAPIADSTPRSDGEPSYRYAPFWVKDEHGHHLLPRFLEFGFAAKYLL